MEQSILFNQKMDAERERSERLRKAAQDVCEHPRFRTLPSQVLDRLAAALRDTAEGGKP